MYKNVLTTNGIGASSGNSLYWRPGIDFENAASNSKTDYADKKGEQNYENSSFKKDSTSRKNSFKMSLKKINNPNPQKPTPPSITKIERKKLGLEQGQ